MTNGWKFARTSIGAAFAIASLSLAVIAGPTNKSLANEGAPNPAAVAAAVDAYWASVSAMDIEAALATFAEDAVSHDPFGAPPISDPDARRQAFHALAQTFESLSFEQNSIHVSGNRSAVKWSSNARMKDGRSVSFEGIDVFEINGDGKIQTLWGYWDPRVLFATERCREYVRPACSGGPKSRPEPTATLEHEMEYLMMLYYDEANSETKSSDEMETQLSAYRAYTKSLIDAGVLRGGNALERTKTSKSVRVRGDKVMTTDGPFAETKEQLGGYYLIECETFEEAMGWASKCPAASTGTVEVRPIWNY